MIEILILYTVFKHEKTIYSIRKEIFEIFGAYTKPSIGTIYPALKRLLSVNAVSLTERLSDGGKKSSYYSITKKGVEYFKTYFFSTVSDNPSLFYTQLQVRFALMGLLSVEERKKFIADILRKLDLIKFEVEAKLNDEFIEFDYYQKRIMNRTLFELKSLGDFIKQLKVDNDG